MCSTIHPVTRRIANEQSIGRREAPATYQQEKWAEAFKISQEASQGASVEAFETLGQTLAASKVAKACLRLLSFKRAAVVSKSLCANNDRSFSFSSCS